MTYVVLVAIVAAMAWGLAAVGPLWADRVRQDREQELIRVGTAYARAIGEYYAQTPNGMPMHPPDLQSLVLDTRFPETRRHLRRMYPDPMSPKRPWGIVRSPNGSVIGIYSQDTRQPFLQRFMDLGVMTLRPSQRYSQWIFAPDAAM